jgi:hypothetical protein
MSRALKIFVLAIACLFRNVDAQTVQEFDFTHSSAMEGWIATHDLAPLKFTAAGMEATITGVDPYLQGPARNYPAGEPLWMNVRIKSECGGNAQVFFFQNGPTEDKSVHFFVPSGDWRDLRVPFPPLGPKTRLRIDPPGSSGVCTIARIKFEPRPIPLPPDWPIPMAPRLDDRAPAISSGDVTFTHGKSLGSFEVRVSGRSMAIGNARSLLGYAVGSSNMWIELTNTVKLAKLAGAISATCNFRDRDGAKWQFAQRFKPANPVGGIDIETTVTVDADRAVVYLPMLTLLPGVGNFGTNKTQGVFAGVEYLENEPSSSEADVIGPGARRKVPDSLKVTFPLMAISTVDAYVGLIWEQQPQFSALFDSPDRTFNSGGHAMAVHFPGADPSQREDGSVLPYGGVMLRANEKLTLRATIIGGRGNTIVPAVQQYVQRRGLPALPNPGYSAQEFFTLEAHGWLDSKIRDGAKFRHAVGNNFGGVAVADAPMYMDWLATKVADDALATRLTEASRSSLALVAPPSFNSAAVGHIRHPVEGLVYGSVVENVATALAQGHSHFGVFQSDGSMAYHAPAQGLDLGRTHWSHEANGLTATQVAMILDYAAFSGDRELIANAMRLLKALNKFRDTVPRGAQTWEVPLHTPDILGSAYLVRAYLLGYELTGDADFLAQAKYWAWTGVPFTYLTPPTVARVGVYSTTPVFGATQFVAPLWIGLPVQWCGLVYGDAIRRLAAFDTEGPWLKLANGIAAAGVQHVHPSSEPDFQGLLPDSFDLRAQNRNPVPINPATLLPEALQFYGAPAVYGFKTFLNHQLLAHCPGPITDVRENKAGVRFRANGWPKQPWYLLITGFEKRPTIKVDDREADFLQSEGRVIIRLEKPSTIDISL